uniref:Pentraxin (PTX) domain-containing protein n=1 Tax=Pundamilia nyererei TaxID=303518 RepID=A0A3B4GN93_9CICH
HLNLVNNKCFTNTESIPRTITEKSFSSVFVYLNRNHNLFSLYTITSICTTWDSESELVQLWLNGKPSIKKFIGGLVITDPVEQDSHGGGFDINQCFVGMMSDVRMWNYDLSPCEIQALEFEYAIYPCLAKICKRLPEKDIMWMRADVSLKPVYTF